MMKQLSAAKILPIAFFGVIAGAFALGLARDPRVIPSMLIDRPLPNFELPPLLPGGQVVRSKELPDRKLVLINVFSSWCGTCRQEHPFLMALGKDARFRLVGLNWKDEPAAAQRLLQNLGNPYSAIGSDPSGRTGIDLGVSGVPETFIVDAEGRVRLRVPGPMSPEIWKSEIEPMLQDKGRPT